MNDVWIGQTCGPHDFRPDMTRIIALLTLLAVAGCATFGVGPEPPGASALSQQTVRGVPPQLWTCFPNREPECQ